MTNKFPRLRDIKGFLILILIKQKRSGGTDLQTKGMSVNVCFFLCRAFVEDRRSGAKTVYPLLDLDGVVLYAG